MIWCRCMLMVMFSSGIEWKVFNKFNIIFGYVEKC